MYYKVDTNQRPSDWYKDAVIYQVYPRSFQDSDGDGVGDLKGITSRLEHLADLGVDTVWLSPIFKSPMKDFGYDVSDYCDIDPLFGELKDFDNLLDKAHSLGLKVMIDQVLSHTSEEHPWFEESRADRTNSKANWYVWADPEDDGTPPNNWMSIFGGSAWQWDTRRRQYYLHNFLTEQPDLNFHEPEVQDALLGTMKFWLDRGVDGFRLDTVNFYFHDAKLRSNPPNIGSLKTAPIHRSHSTYDHQHHFYDKSQPENLGWLTRMRQLCNSYNAVLLGEVGCEWQIERMVEYTQGNNRLHTAYSFAFFGADHSAEFIREQLRPFIDNQDDTWPCWATSNHDVERLASRWKNSGEKEATRLALEGYLVMLATLFGTPCIYQGEELGLTEAELDFEDLVDPPGITFWPEYKGRDGCRTPMVWDASTFGSFSDTKPWLPVPEAHLSKNLQDQINDSESLVNFYKRILHWRKETPASRRGTFKFLDMDPNLLAYSRELDCEVITVIINLSEYPTEASAVDGELCFGQSASVLEPGGYQVLISKL